MKRPFIDIESIENAEDRGKVIAVMAVINERNKRGFWRMKRAIDFLFALCALIGLFIPMLIIAILIYAEDGHSPFYSQTRIGRMGKPFKMYKFRTMVPNADKMREKLQAQNEMDGPVFKIKKDPRITKIGRILRKTSLDELPQFYNVLIGNMCVIGPRPPLPNEYKEYNEYQKIRLLITPGITCLWQISPRRNSISFEEWIDMDIDYVINRSFLMDIKITIMTVLVMLRGEGE